MYPITVRITKRLSTTCHRKIKSKENRQFRNNLIRIPLRPKDNNATNKRTKKYTAPSFYLINARSTLPKIDDSFLLLSINPVDVAAITESWLHKDMEDNLLYINGSIYHVKIVQ